MDKNTIPDFDWPTCPDCGRPVVVTRGGETGSETWFTFCCWDGPDRDNPLAALQAFAKEMAQDNRFAMPYCPKCGGVVLVVHEDCNGDPKGYRAACTKECPHMFAYGRTPQIALQGFFESTAYARGDEKPERVQPL